jgi:hypothetical protein
MSQTSPDYGGDRKAGPITVFAQYPDRSVAHLSAGNAEMNTGKEEGRQDQ